MNQPERGHESFPREPTNHQTRLYANLSTSIADAIDSARSVPCIQFPAMFDRVEQEIGGRPAEHGMQEVPRNPSGGRGGWCSRRPPAQHAAARTLPT
jgi:hypothetical protein